MPGWISVRLGLPLCDADKCYTQPSAQKVSKAVEAVDGIHGIHLATPVYNYDVSAAAKNMVELIALSGFGMEEHVRRQPGSPLRLSSDQARGIPGAESAPPKDCVVIRYCRIAVVAKLIRFLLWRLVPFGEKSHPASSTVVPR